MICQFRRSYFYIFSFSFILSYLPTLETLQQSFSLSLTNHIVRSRCRDIDESLLDGFEFEAQMLRDIRKKSKIIVQKTFTSTYSTIADEKAIDVFLGDELHVKFFTDEAEIVPQIINKVKNIDVTKESSDMFVDPTILWLPRMKIFPTVDAIITRGVKEVLFLSITTSKSHSLVLKCLKSKDPSRGARNNRRAPLTYSGLLPLILAMKKNGFKMVN